MSEQQDRSYYADRAAQEQDSGNRATDPATAAIHFELAYRYSLMADGIATLMPQKRAAHA